MAVRNHANTLDITSTSNLGRKYCANKEFFAVPNMLNSYWAGFLAADGNIRPHRKRISVKLHIKDASHLEKFREALEYTGKVYRYEKDASLEIACPEMADDLVRNFNVTPKKSFTLEPPFLTDEDMICAFIVGLIDGDGSITIKDAIRHYPRIAIYGTQAILKWVQTYFDKWSPITNYKRSEVCFVPQHNLYAYRIGATRAINMGKKLMQPDLPRLERKWNVLRSCF